MANHIISSGSSKAASCNKHIYISATETQKFTVSEMNTHHKQSHVSSGFVITFKRNFNFQSFFYLGIVDKRSQSASCCKRIKRSELQLGNAEGEMNNDSGVHWKISFNRFLPPNNPDLE